MRIALTPGRRTGENTPFDCRWPHSSRGIDRGYEVRFDKDFSGVVHFGCHPAAVTITRVDKTFTLHRP
jgi:hypothetical protein